ncbi:MAG: hypothetical protein ABSH28_04220 [Acidobacteriota bacterium]
MGMQRIPANVLRATLVAILALPLLAAQTIQLKRGQRIYVVVVRTVGDAQLFNSCPPTHPPAGFHQTAFLPAKPVTFRAPELFSSREELVPGGIPDAELKSRLEKEFQKQKKYQIVSSPQDADFVFLAEAKFIAIVGATIKSQDGPKPPEFPIPRLSSDGSIETPDIVFPLPNPGGIYFKSGQLDEKANLLLRAFAIVVQAGNRENINDAFLHISEDLSHQYTLCYYPANRSRDDAFRRIRVEVDRGEVKIQTRSGYRVGTQAANAK